MTPEMAIGPACPYNSALLLWAHRPVTAVRHCARPVSERRAGEPHLAAPPHCSAAKTGPDGTGQGRTDRDKTERNGTERNGTERNGTEWNGVVADRDRDRDWERDVEPYSLRDSKFYSILNSINSSAILKVCLVFGFSSVYQSWKLSSNQNVSDFF